MDRLSFVFSLLLVVSVTTITFGSVIKAKNSNGEELEAFLKRSHHQSNPDMKTDAQAKLQGQNGLKDQESEISKRVDPVTLIPVTATVASLEERVKSDSADNDFQIAICIENQSGSVWDRFSSYVDKGTKPEMRDEVPHGDRALASSSGEQGVAGVLVYYVEHIRSSLAILYNVRDNHIVWYVQLNKDDETPANEGMFNEMFPDSYDADDHWKDANLGDTELKYNVRMTKAHQAALEILISKSVEESSM